jgi:pimeloyl-ACP methyl ester carboxylesterase
VPQLVRDEVTIVYDTFGDGEPLLLLCGCGQPAVAWHLTLVPALVEAGYRVITFDNRGVAPSSSPPPPYSIGQMVDDTLALLHHLGIEQARVAGHSMGGWIAETLAIEHPDRVRGAALMGSCNLATSWEKAITTVERDIALADLTMPPLYFATETLRYLPNSDLQDDAVVDAWLGFIADTPPWPNPGRLGQWEACLAWSLDTERTKGWATISVPCMVLAFEHDIDSPPARAREAAAVIPGARYAEVMGASHIGVFTHGREVADLLLDFFAPL